jgi:hypothetical protein
MFLVIPASAGMTEPENQVVTKRYVLNVCGFWKSCLLKVLPETRVSGVPQPAFWTSSIVTSIPLLVGIPEP